MAGQFHKQITNARNSNDDFDVKIEEDPLKSGGERRTSAAHLQQSIIHGLGTKKNFTTITPHGIPADFIENDQIDVERQNILNEPQGQKNEGARLPPFKPFKTISDEDNIHLLPGETGERARLNLLDTKVVTTKDVNEVRNAYFRLRQQYPQLYRKQQAPEPEPISAQPELQKKKGFFGKLFGKKQKEPEKEPIKEEKKPDEEQPKVKPDDAKKHEHKHHQPGAKPSIIAQAEVSKPVNVNVRRKIGTQKSDSSESSSTESEESSEDEDHNDEQSYYNRMMEWYKNHPQAGEPQPQYPGFPGGYGMPPYNQAYAGGFGPMQGPPIYNPCVDEIQYCRQMQTDQKKCQGSRKRLKKPQGLNFDFLPHDDLATEVTMIIEPDEPEPLQYAVENGIMPIICCYMPSSLAVSQPPTNSASFSGYPVASNGYTGGTLSSSRNRQSTITRTSQQNSSGTTSKSKSGSTSNLLPSDVKSKSSAPRKERPNKNNAPPPGNVVSVDVPA